MQRTIVREISTYDIFCSFAYCLSLPNLGIKYKFVRTRKFFYHCISSAWNTLSQSRCLTNIWCMKENENDTTILRDNTDSIIMKQHKRRWMIDTNAMICLYLYLSLTRWTWVWVNSGSWWWTGRPGVLWFMGSQRVGHNWVTELNWVSSWQGDNACSASHRLSSSAFFSYRSSLGRVLLSTESRTRRCPMSVGA